MTKLVPDDIPVLQHMSAQIDLIVNILQQTGTPAAPTLAISSMPVGSSPKVGENEQSSTADLVSPLPDPDRIRKIIRQRKLRAAFFDATLFADPAWDMLLDLAAATRENINVSTSSLCIAANVPATTALRWISVMSDAGLLEKVEDTTDRRRNFVVLSEKAVDALDRYFKAAFRSE